jgi:hypothetical protein
MTIDGRHFTAPTLYFAPPACVAQKVAILPPRFDSVYIHDGGKSSQYGRLHDRPDRAMYRGI